MSGAYRMSGRPAGPRAAVGPGRDVEAALVDVVRDSRASAAMLYVLETGADALWLAVLTGVPRHIAAPWIRVALTDPLPVADAVREGRLVWVGGTEEFARRYPRPSLVLPYDFVLAAAPVADGGALQGGLVLLWPGSHSARLGSDERALVETACGRLGRALRAAAEAGELVPCKRPRTIAPEPDRELGPPEALAAFVERLPGGSCALDLNGRISFITREAAALVGADPADLLGALPWEALPWTDVPEVEDRYRAALVSKMPTSFTALRPPDTRLTFELYPDASGISVRITPCGPGPKVPEPGAAPPAGPSRATVLYHLMHLAATLTEAAGVKDVVAQSADQLMPALGAQAMALLAAEDGRLRVLGHRGYSDALIERFDDIPLTPDTPAARAMLTGEAGFFGDFAELRRAHPQAVHRDGMESWAVLPLIASGRPIGSLVLAYDRHKRFPATERAVLTSLAGLIGQALERARLYDTQHDVARRLQAALLPHSLPRVPGLDVTARYLPAGRGLDVGGDFYDLIRLDDTTAAAAIGDVQGHNIDAAALMGQVRTAVHAHATAGAPPDDVLRRTNRLLIDLDSDLFTSCLYTHVDMARRELCMATAGHTRPLLRHADGRTDVLAVPPGLLLGIDPEADYPTLGFPLPPGCVLLLYTDGLVEEPGVDPDDALDSLGDLLRSADPADLDALADTLVQHVPNPVDDIALLLMRFRTTGG
ncbi:SpoIIE family protein phosphatase [Streptomyces sp. NPDC059015]|uniref:SpoIIE family protein phosphatase n=1 Tax=unclassified Streptomyces TaxID=2593676 RepID=UPI0036B93C89